MKRITIKELYASPETYAGKKITVAGWCRSIRANDHFGFIDLNDGSTLPCLQVVFEAEKMENYREVAKQNVGASFAIEGVLELTPAAKGEIIEAAYDPIYGARPLRRYLQHSVETLIGRKIIADQVTPGAVLTVDVKDGQLTVE